MINIGTFTLVLLTMLLGVMTTYVKCTLQQPHETSLVKSTLVLSFLDHIICVNHPELPEKICCTEKYSIIFETRNSVLKRKNRANPYPEMMYTFCCSMTKNGHVQNNLNIFLQNAEEKGSLLDKTMIVSEPHKILRSLPATTRWSFSGSDRFLTQWFNPSFTLADLPNQRAIINQIIRNIKSYKSRTSNISFRNCRTSKYQTINSTIPICFRIYNSIYLILFIGSENKKSLQDQHQFSCKHNVFYRSTVFVLPSRSTLLFFTKWSCQKCLPSMEKYRNLCLPNLKFIFRTRQAKTCPVQTSDSQIRLLSFYNGKSLFTYKVCIFRMREGKGELKRIRIPYRLRNLFGKVHGYNSHTIIVFVNCTGNHFTSSQQNSEQTSDFDLTRNLQKQIRNGNISYVETQAYIGRTLNSKSKNRRVRQLSNRSYLRQTIANESYQKDYIENNISHGAYIATLSHSAPDRQQINTTTISDTSLELSTNNDPGSRHPVKRSDSRHSRQVNRFERLNIDGSLPVSSSSDIFGSYLDSSSSLSPLATATLSPQPVSLKVVVYLSVNRGYQRVLESAIFTGTRDFHHLMKYIEPSAKLVKLKGDHPRDILHAFCEDILEPNTTAVFHLVNPFFHTRSWSSAQYVSNLLSTLDMPIITWGPEYIGTTDKKESELLQLNISPTLYHQAQAMLEVLHHYNWTQFCVVYTPVPGHDTFITAVRILVNDNNSKVQKNGFKYNIIEQIEISNISDRTIINKDLKMLAKTEARIILLYCMEGDTLNIVEEATNMGLMTDEYLWFLTFEAVNKNKHQNANNLPLGLLGIYYEYREDEMEHAIKTAVGVWFRGLNQSVMTSDTSDGHITGIPWSMPNFECQSSKSLIWEDGPKFYDIMRNVSFNNVAFNELGQLKMKDISIVNIQPPVVGEEDQKWRQVGKFTADGIQMRHITWPGETVHPPLGRPKRHLLRIVTREEPPFVEYRELNKNGTCGHFSYFCQVYQRDINEVRITNTTVKRCCTGLSIDFLHRLSQSLDFEFFLYEVEDYQWGSKNPDGTWDGIVGDLRSGRADMAISSMTIDEDRSSGIDFSMPYMETGITFMVAIRDGAISATAFLEPYDYPSWCIILVCSVHVTGASIFIFEWFSPNGLDHGRRLSTTNVGHAFGAAVTTDTPRGVSSKFVSNIWALFALVFSASYTANLAAFMITKEEYFDLRGMQDRRLQNPYTTEPPFRFATIPNGTTESNIKKNNYRMYEYMKKYSQRSVEQAMEALKNQKIHAFIYDASVLEYQEGKDKDCKLITVGNWYATTGYGVGFPFGSPWLERVNKVILNLQSEGEMERLKEFWLAGACHTKRKKNTNNRGIGNGVSSTTLGILNFTSAFIFLATGTGLAILIFIMEYMYFWFGRKRLSSWDKKGCCALISLSMGMSLSFQKSVKEALDIHRRSKNKCKSPVCETSLWRANRELRIARSEINRLQTELTRATLEGASNVIWRYDPVSTSKPHLHDQANSWDYDNNAHDYRDEQETVRVTLL